MKKGEILIAVMLLVSIGLVSPSILREYMCEKTYEGMMENKTNQQLIQEIYDEEKYRTNDNTLNHYKNDWENLCANIVGRTLRPEEVCQRVYYFIAQTDYNYTDEELGQLCSDMNLSSKVVESYLYNNKVLCVSEGYSEQLPEMKLPKLIIYENNITNCDLNVSRVLSWSAPFFDINIGEPSCNTNKFLKYFVELEDFDREITIKGIRIYFMISIIFLLAIIKLVRYGLSPIETETYLK